MSGEGRSSPARRPEIDGELVPGRPGDADHHPVVGGSLLAGDEHVTVIDGACQDPCFAGAAVSLPADVRDLDPDLLDRPQQPGRRRNRHLLAGVGQDRPERPVVLPVCLTDGEPLAPHVDPVSFAGGLECGDEALGSAGHHDAAVGRSGCDQSFDVQQAVAVVEVEVDHARHGEGPVGECHRRRGPGTIGERHRRAPRCRLAGQRQDRRAADVVSHRVQDLVHGRSVPGVPTAGGRSPCRPWR